jgi:hypothetical protein
MATRRPPTSTPGNENPLERVSWNGNTFQLPPLLPPSATSQAKDIFYRKTIQGLDAASDAPALTKLNLLESRFHFSNLAHAVDSSLKILLDTTSGWENPPIVLTPGPVFGLSDPSIRNQAAADLPLPGADVEPVPANVRRNGMYYTFQVLINTREAYSGSPEIAAQAGLLTDTLTVAVRLPRVQPEEGELDHGAFTNLHPLLTSNVLRNPANTLQTVTDITGNAPILGTLRRTAADVAATHDQDAFRTLYMNLFHKTRYSLYRVLLQLEFIGKNVVPLATLQADLQRVKQAYQDPATRTFVYHTVAQYYDRFNAALSMFSHDRPYPLDVASAFWVGLLPSIKETALAENYEIPMFAGPDSVQLATERLRGVKEAAVGFERKVNQVATAIAHHNTRTGSRGGMRSFLFAPTAGDHTHGEYPDGEYATQSTTTNWSTPQDDTLSIQDPASMPQAAVLLAATIYLSAAEQALQTATGNTFPPLECWGCKDHPLYHGERFHRWMECPHRGDRTAQDNAKKSLQTFILDRQKRQQQAGPQRGWGNPYGPSPNPPSATASFATSTDWQKEGWHSEIIADLVCQMADPNTRPFARSSCFNSLIEALPKKSSDLPRKSPRNNEAAAPTSKGGILHLHFTTTSRIAVMQAAAAPRAHLSISQQMPHILFPVGDESTGTLRSMVDTCAGLNLGRFSYHWSIWKTSPHLVHSFILLKDVDYLDEFDIGGVDEHGNATKVIAVITYKTPFRVSGQPVLLSYGLSESASTNTILGLPFLRATRSAFIMTGDDDEVLICQRLGATFRVDYQVPLRANKAPTSAPDTHAAYPCYAETPTSVTDGLETLTQLLTTVTLATLQDSPPDESPSDDDDDEHEHDDTWTLKLDLPDIE